jgi:hypothetical protein
MTTTDPITHQDYLDAADLRWTLDAEDEAHADLAQLWTESGAMLLMLQRETTAQLWVVYGSEVIDHANLSQIPAVLRLQDIDLGAVLDLESDSTPDVIRDRLLS